MIYGYIIDVFLKQTWTAPAKSDFRKYTLLPLFMGLILP